MMENLIKENHLTRMFGYMDFHRNAAYFQKLQTVVMWWGAWVVWVGVFAPDHKKKDPIMMENPVKENHLTRKFGYMDFT